MAGSEHSLDIGHDGLQILALVEEHTIPVGNLILPVLLPLREGRLLQQTMRFDNELRGCSLEAYATLNTDDGVAHVGITTDGIRSTNLLDLLDGLNLIIELFTIDSHDLTFLESNLQRSLLLFGSDVLQIGVFGQSLGGIKQLTTTDTGAPDTYIIRVL